MLAIVNVSLLLFTFGVIGFLAPHPEASGQTAQDWLRRGKELTQAGRFNEALMAFDRFKQENPKDPRPYIYSGIALVKAGRLKDVGIELNQVRDLRLEEASDALAYARVLSDLGHAKLASDILSGFEDSSRLDQEGLWLLSDLYYGQKKAAEALRVLEQYGRRYPSDPRVEERRGEIHLLAGNLEQALESFEQVVDREPDNARAQYSLGRSLWLGNNPEAAKRVALRAVELDPENPTYLHLLGLACQKLNQTGEAIRYLEKASQSSARFSQIYFDLGNTYRQAGNSERAREVLAHYRELFSAEEAQRNRDQKLLQLTNQGIQQFESGAAAEAYSSFQRVLEIDPDAWAAHLHLAKIYLSSNQRVTAYRHLEKLQQLDSSSSEGNYLMAYYWYEEKQYEKALEYAQKAKRLRPGHPDLRNLLGNIHVMLGRREEALEEYSAAVSLAPERAAFRINYDSLSRKPERPPR